MRRIIDGTAYDTETAELIKKLVWDESEEEAEILYRTRHGAFFLYHRGVIERGPRDDPDYEMKEGIIPWTNERAQKWLEEHGNELVEKYFGEMPEGGSAERRLTLRMPNNLAERLEEIAKTKATPLNRYINRCLERAAEDDGRGVDAMALPEVPEVALPEVSEKIMKRSYHRSGVVAGGILLSSGAKKRSYLLSSGAKKRP